MLVLSVEMLKSKGACPEGIISFEKNFGETLEIKSKEQAIELTLSYEFKEDILFLENFITDTKAYVEAKEPLWISYFENEEPLWEAYVKAKDQLWKDYIKTKELPRNDYIKAKSQLWKDYEKAKEPIQKAYKKAAINLIVETLWNESIAS